MQFEKKGFVNIYKAIIMSWCALFNMSDKFSHTVYNFTKRFKNLNGKEL